MTEQALEPVAPERSARTELSVETAHLCNWRLAVAMVISACFAVAAFLPAIDNAFVYDDMPVVVRNPAVDPAAKPQQSVPWHRLFISPYYPRGESADKLYRPVTILSLRINRLFAGDKLTARPLRVGNILIHALACAGVVLLASRLTGSEAAGLLAGVLFAAHPVHTEAVTPIYGRSELLAGCLGAWLLARHVKSPADRPRTVRYQVLNAVLFLAAIGSKEHALFIWPALMAIDVWHRRRIPSEKRPRLREWLNHAFAPSHLGLMLAAALFLFGRYWVFGWKTHMEGSRTRIWEVPMAHVGLVEHLLTPFRLMWVAFQNLFWTESLCPIWSYPALSPANHVTLDVALGMLLMLLMLIGVVLLWKRGNMAGAILLGLVFSLLIPLQFIPVTRWFYAERWLYLPTVFVVALLAPAMSCCRRVSGIIGLGLAVMLLPQTWQYSAKFADDLTLHREVIVRQPNNFHSRSIHAKLLYFNGRHAAAVQAANQMIERFGPVSDAYVVLLYSYLELGDGRRALQAIDQYEYLRRNIGEPALDSERRRALALIAREPTGPVGTSIPAGQ